MFGLFGKKNKANTASKNPDTVDISQHGVEMEEIFSTTEKKIRYTKTDPLTVPKQPRNYGNKQKQQQQTVKSDDMSITNTTSVTSIIRALGNAFNKMDGDISEEIDINELTEQVEKAKTVSEAPVIVPEANERYIDLGDIIVTDNIIKDKVEHEEQIHTDIEPESPYKLMRNMNSSDEPDEEPVIKPITDMSLVKPIEIDAAFGKKDEYVSLSAKPDVGNTNINNIDEDDDDDDFDNTGEGFKGIENIDITGDIEITGDISVPYYGVPEQTQSIADMITEIDDSMTDDFDDFDDDDDDDFDEDDLSYSRLHITGQIAKKAVEAAGKTIPKTEQTAYAPDDVFEDTGSNGTPISAQDGRTQTDDEFVSKGDTHEVILDNIPEPVAFDNNNDVGGAEPDTIEVVVPESQNTSKPVQEDEISLIKSVFNKDVPVEPIADEPSVDGGFAEKFPEHHQKYAQIYENLYSKLNQPPTESRYEKFFGAPKPVARGTSSEAVVETTRIEKAEIERAEKELQNKKGENKNKFVAPPYEYHSPQRGITVISMSKTFTSVLREAYLAYSDKKEENEPKEKRWEPSAFDVDPPQKFTITISSKKLKESRERREKQQLDELDSMDYGSIIAKPFKNVDDESSSDDHTSEIPKFTSIPKEKEKKKTKFNLFSSEEDDNPLDDPENTDKPLSMIDDFEGPEDFKTVKTEISMNVHKLVFKTTVVLIISVVLIGISFLQRFAPDNIRLILPKAPLMYVFFNFILLGAAVFICNVTLTNGLSALLSLKGNSDTVLAFTCVTGLVQCISAFFATDKFYNKEFNLYAPIISLALLLNCAGKLIMMLRIRRNFAFVASEDEKYAAKIYTDEKKAQKLMTGIPVSKPIITFQRKTGFLKNFLKLSYSPDPSEDAAGRITPLAIIGSIAVAVAYGFIAKSFIGALSALCVVAVVFTPAAALIAINFPISKLCKRALSSDGMLVGYPAVRQFSDCNAIMIDAKELYPKGSIILNGIKTFSNQRIDDAILACAAIFNTVDSTMTGIFDSMIKGNLKVLTNVESVAYEDGDGLVGWVNGDRVLVGSRHLLELHGIDPPDMSYEDKFKYGNRQITYVAISGELVAMFITTYKADPVISASLQRMEYNGMSFLVTTVDHNVTAERVSDDFGVFYRTVKILPHDVADYCKNAKSKYEEKSRCYVATKGSIASLGRVISGCVAIKSRLSMSIIIQMISIILGVLTVSVLVLYSGLKFLGTIEILIYVMFWSLASIFAPQIYVDY